MSKPTPGHHRKAAAQNIQRGRPEKAPPAEMANRRGIAKPDATGERDRFTSKHKRGK
jgi:hypothetical protein